MNNVGFIWPAVTLTQMIHRKLERKHNVNKTLTHDLICEPDFCLRLIRWILISKVRKLFLTSHRFQHILVPERLRWLIANDS